MNNKNMRKLFFSCFIPSIILSGIVNANDNNSLTTDKPELTIEQAMKTLGVIRPIEVVPMYDDISPNIVGGVESEIGASSYQVSLRQNSQHICGSALISAEWVVTAAHCMGGSNYSVKVGALRLSGNEGQVINIAEKFVHPEYNSMLGRQLLGLINPQINQATKKRSQSIF